VSARRYTPGRAALDCLPGSILAWFCTALLLGAMDLAGAPMGPIIGLGVVFAVIGPLHGWLCWWQYKREDRKP
jgi:hypothetical protein